MPDAATYRPLTKLVRYRLENNASSQLDHAVHVGSGVIASRSSASTVSISRPRRRTKRCPVRMGKASPEFGRSSPDSGRPLLAAKWA